LEGVTLSFVTHVSLRQPVQVVVDYRRKLLERGLVAFAPGLQ
jgi:hypothetical protein